MLLRGTVFAISFWIVLVFRLAETYTAFGIITRFRYSIETVPPVGDLVRTPPFFITDVAIRPDRRFLYIAHQVDGNGQIRLAAVDLITNSVASTHILSCCAMERVELLASPAKRCLAFLYRGDDYKYRVHVIDMALHQLVGSPSISERAGTPDFSVDGSRPYVSTIARPAIVNLVSATVARTVDLTAPSVDAPQLVLDEARSGLYVFPRGYALVSPVGPNLRHRLAASDLEALNATC